MKSKWKSETERFLLIERLGEETAEKKGEQKRIFDMNGLDVICYRNSTVFKLHT